MISSGGVAANKVRLVARRPAIRCGWDVYVHQHADMLPCIEQATPQLAVALAAMTAPLVPGPFSIVNNLPY
jgi:hypothetical protein